jgi:hypothetical protein
MYADHTPARFVQVREEIRQEAEAEKVSFKNSNIDRPPVNPLYRLAASFAVWKFFKCLKNQSIRMTAASCPV